MSTPESESERGPDLGPERGPEREPEREPERQPVIEPQPEPSIEHGAERKIDPNEPITKSKLDTNQAPELTKNQKTNDTADEAGVEEAHQTRRSSLLILVKDKLVEKSPEIKLVPKRKLSSASRRDFLLYGAGVATAASGMWWLLPDDIKAKLGFNSTTGSLKKHFLENILSFDDAVGKSLYSKTTLVPTYSKRDLTEVPNNYAGQTPDGGFIKDWQLHVKGLKGNKDVYLSERQLLNDFTYHEQITRLVCVEGWSAISSWGGLRFSDLIAKYPPPEEAKWLLIRSDVNLDSDGNSDPYFVSLDMSSAVHPQTLLATHHNGKQLEIEHGAPLRLLAPMKLGLKNIKAITSIEYVRNEPLDYWNQNGYSYYDGI